MRNDGAVLTMTGRAATNPTISGGKGERISFRAVSTERRFDEAGGEWIDGDEFGVTVVCWRQLGAAVLQLVRKGDPVVVVGRISTRKFDREGVVDYFTEVKADHVGFDVAKANGRIKREEGSAAVKPAHDQAAVPAVPAPESGDPFQDEPGPLAERELLDVI